MWQKEQKSFKDVQFDILEQIHFSRELETIKDYMMFINAGLLPSGKFTYLKLLKT
jgi:hypothetical protein